MNVSGITENQSTGGISHEQCNKFIEEKDKTILELKGKVSKLKEKLKIKDCELI